jgi:hypothetical protein
MIAIHMDDYCSLCRGRMLCIYRLLFLELEDFEDEDFEVLELGLLAAFQVESPS